MQYFLWTLEVLQGDGNREKPGTWMWGYLCVSVFQMATICIKENWEIALSEKVKFRITLAPPVTVVYLRAKLFYCFYYLK